MAGATKFIMRGRVAGIDDDSGLPFVTVPELGVERRIGPCLTIRGDALAVGDYVLCVSVQGTPEDLAVIGKFGGPLSFAARFQDLTDVDWTTPPTDGQGFVWNEAVGKLEPYDFPDVLSVDRGVVGSFLFWPADTEPDGPYLEANGGTASVAAWPELFAKYGTKYGGDGVTTFGLPNVKGRMMVAKDSTQVEFDVVGETGGAKTVTLTALQSGIQTHTHALRMASSGAPSGTGDRPLRATTGDDGNFRTSTPTVGETYGSTSYPTGKDAVDAHQNLPPYFVGRVFIRAAKFGTDVPAGSVTPGHTHLAEQIVGGTMDIARLPVADPTTQEVSASKLVRADDPRLMGGLFAVDVATTSTSITLSGLQTIDGVALTAGAVVLVWSNSSAAALNGVYVVSAGAWTRHPYFDTAAKLAGAMVRVLRGTRWGGWTFKSQFRATDVLGTTTYGWTRVTQMRFLSDIRDGVGPSANIGIGATGILTWMIGNVSIPSETVQIRAYLGTVASAATNCAGRFYFHRQPSAGGAVDTMDLHRFHNNTQPRTSFNTTLIGERDWIEGIDAAAYNFFVTGDSDAGSGAAVECATAHYRIAFFGGR